MLSPQQVHDSLAAVPLLRGRASGLVRPCALEDGGHDCFGVDPKLDSQAENALRGLLPLS